MINVILRKKSFFQDTMAQLEEMRKAYNLLQEQATHSEQQLADAEAERLRLGVAADSEEVSLSVFLCLLFKDCILSYSIIFYNIL